MPLMPGSRLGPYETLAAIGVWWNGRGVEGPRYSPLIDPLTGTIAPIPIGPDVEAGVPQWTRDGKIVASGTMYAMSIWRFHPVP